MHEFLTNNVRNDDSTQSNVKDYFSDDNIEKNAVVEQTLPTISNSFQDESKILEYQDASSVKTEVSDQTP